ncbi:MAG: histidinol-phosphate transaminase [Pseudomonadota bacterium]
MTKPNLHIAKMAAYALADLSAPPGKRLISLSQNESLRGPSPRAINAASEATTNAYLYPDPDWTSLRTALATHHSIDAQNILLGSGSLDLIGCITRTYLAPVDAALAPAHAYPFFSTATLLTGARFDNAPETNLHADPEALLSSVTPETKILFLANPGNPTGSRLPRTEILRLRDALPDDILLVLDEAYGEFADHLTEPMFDLAETSNTIILRTFSKAYGLAGLRIGWGLFPAHIAAEVRKTLNPNNITLPTLAAAEAALGDQDWMRGTCTQTARIRDTFATNLRQLGFDIPQSFSNFTLIPFASAQAAAEADSYLKSEGLFLRPQSGAALPHVLRATTGVQRDMDIAANLIEDWTKRRAPT